jgi:hypothetical protein
MYARVAVYRIQTGTAQAIARKADDEGGMLKIFRAHVGFDSYELIGVGDTLISISRWQTADQADAASMAARSWVAEYLGASVQLEANRVASSCCRRSRWTPSSLATRSSARRAARDHRAGRRDRRRELSAMARRVTLFTDQLALPAGRPDGADQLRS